MSEAVVQNPPAVDPYADRAHYFTDENGFSFSWPAVPVHQFLAERDAAFDSYTPTSVVALDLAALLETPYPATTPTLLCRYLKIRAGESLQTSFAASGEIFYVLQGSGRSTNGGDTLGWATGDVFCFPGGSLARHEAGKQDGLLFCVTNEPLLAFERLRPPAPGNAAVQTTRWPAAEIERRLQKVYLRPIAGNSTGAFVQFATLGALPSTATLPSVNVSINTLASGGDQRPHRHNGVAITLAIEGEGVYSMIGGERCDWSNGAAQITPAALLHSHHNRGPRRMRSFVIQDEGLHIYTRTPGFSFD
jgi:gentisate 1,2-dioxygenase